MMPYDEDEIIYEMPVESSICRHRNAGLSISFSSPTLFVHDFIVLGTFRSRQGIGGWARPRGGSWGSHRRQLAHRDDQFSPVTILYLVFFRMTEQRATRLVISGTFS